MSIHILYSYDNCIRFNLRIYERLVLDSELSTCFLLNIIIYCVRATHKQSQLFFITNSNM